MSHLEHDVIVARQDVARLNDIMKITERIAVNRNGMQPDFPRVEICFAILQKGALLECSEVVEHMFLAIRIREIEPSVHHSVASLRSYVSDEGCVRFFCGDAFQVEVLHPFNGGFSFKEEVAFAAVLVSHQPLRSLFPHVLRSEWKCGEK